MIQDELWNKKYDEIFSYETSLKIMNSDKKVMENKKSYFMKNTLEAKGKNIVLKNTRCLFTMKIIMYQELW